MPSKNNSRVLTLETIAHAWNEAGLDYAVLHGVEHYPNDVGRDLDVIVRPSHSARALAIAAQSLRDQGYVVATPSPIWGRRLIAAPPGGWADALEIHTIAKLPWRSAVVVQRPSPTARIGPFAFDQWGGFAKRVIMPILADDIQRFVKKAHDLQVSDDEWPVIMPHLNRLIGPRLADELHAAVTAGDRQRLQQLVRPIRSAATQRSWLRSPLQAARGIAWSLTRKIMLPFHPCGPVVAFVGPDGVGKSTLLRILKDGDKSIFLDIITRHSRPSVLPRIGVLFGRSYPVIQPGEFLPPRREPGKFPFFRNLYYFVDFVVGGFAKDRMDSSRQRLVLYDRCPLDMLVDPVRYGLSSIWLLELLEPLIPKPDLIILLQDEPARIYARKPEIEVEEIARQLDQWRTRASRSRAYRVMDVNAPPEEIAARVRRLIVDAFLEKNS